MLRSKSHYVYKTSDIDTGEYYIGMHTGYVDDNYLGSGNWIKHHTIKDRLRKEILKYAENKHELRRIEKQFIEQHKNHSLNRNNTKKKFHHRDPSIIYGEYYTIPEAAHKLNVSYKTIRYYADGELSHCIKQSGKKRYITKEFIDMVSSKINKKEPINTDKSTIEQLLKIISIQNDMLMKYYLSENK